MRQILSEKLKASALTIYEQIKDQVDIEGMNKLGIYPAHAAIAYREEGSGPLREFHYLLGGMSQYGVKLYHSIFSAFARHLLGDQKLSKTDLSVNVPLTGEVVFISHPLLELLHLTYQDVLDRLSKTKLT